ncbi:MAG: ABC transporter ATP-binding protein/permease [Rhodothermia bacterium]|nr:ABC transporter ATP-binding protein/permease [Rhodothermia bacterium]
MGANRKWILHQRARALFNWVAGTQQFQEAAQPTNLQRNLRVLRYALPYWPILALILFLNLLMAVTVALQPWPLKILIDNALGDAQIPTALESVLARLSIESSPGVLIVTAALASVVIFGFNALLNTGTTWAAASAGPRMAYDLSADLFHHLQRLSLRFHGTRKVGDLLSRLVRDAWCVDGMVRALLISPWSWMLTLGSVSVLAWQLDPGLTLLTLVAAPAVTINVLFFGPRIKRRQTIDREAHARLTSFVHQSLRAVPLVQSFGTESRTTEQYRRLGKDVVVQALRNVKTRESYRFLNGFAMSAGAAVVIGAGGFRVLGGALTIGSLLVFVAYFRSIESAFRGLLGTYATVKSLEANSDRVMEVLEVQNEVREVRNPIRLRNRVKGRIEFDSVDFGYYKGQPVLRELNLEIQPGETVALVGESGAGKSTLACLVPRLFDPWQGAVRIDGHDLRQLHLADLRAQISIALQEPFLIPLSVAENIAYGKPGASLDEIENAAKASGAHEFIQHMKHGYDTVVGQRGSDLSGGERQRLTTARALLQDAPILILDEPTSELDANSENLFVEALNKLTRNRTTLIIAHRLSTIRDVDRIVVLEAGRVVETGSHDELVAAGGHYYQLYTSQRRSLTAGVA